MADRFFDTSAFAKHYRTELGTADQVNKSVRYSVFDPLPQSSTARCKPGTTLDDLLRDQFFDQQVDQHQVDQGPRQASLV
jgi:hypothetical protein